MGKITNAIDDLIGLVNQRITNKTASDSIDQDDVGGSIVDVLSTIKDLVKGNILKYTVVETPDGLTPDDPNVQMQIAAGDQIEDERLADWNIGILFKGGQAQTDMYFYKEQADTIVTLRQGLTINIGDDVTILLIG